MANAKILKNGIVIQIDGLPKDQIRSDLDGFLVEFRIGDSVYIYRLKQQFKLADLLSNEASSGYYLKDKFLKYFGNEISLSELKKYSLDREKGIKRAVVNDEILVNGLFIDPNEKIFYKTVTWKYDYDGNINNVLDGNLRIRIPDNAKKITEIITTVNNEAKIFYNKRILILENFKIEEKSEAEYLINKISLLINMINQDVFPSFNTPPESLNSFVVDQNKYWQEGNIFNDYSISSLNAFFSGLSQFYKLTYPNQAAISKSNGLDKMYWIGMVLPVESLQLITIKQRIDILEKLALKSELSDFLEEYVLKLVNSIDINKQNEVNEFLTSLIDRKYPTSAKLPPYQNNLYSLLYNKVENYNSLLKATLEFVGNHEFSKDNRTRLVSAILFLWTESKYNPYKNPSPNGEPDYSLIENNTYQYSKNIHQFSILNYESKKNSFGIYNDSFTFEFDPWGNGIYWITPNKDYSLSSSSSLNLYQPISLVSYPSETDTSIQLPKKDGELNGLIPLFYLAYVDREGDREDFNTKIGILVDVVATFSGIGNLAKLRHLRYLSRLGQILVILETVQIGASIINFILKFSEDCDNSQFCKKLKTLLFFIEISQLVTDPIAMAKAKKSAQNVVAEGIENGWPSGMLDEIDGITPKQKIEEIAGMDIVDYLDKYVSEGKKELLEKISKENEFKKSLGLEASLANYYTNSQIEEILTLGAGKGLSKEDAMGILHQANRIRSKPYIAPMDILKERLDNLIIVRERGFPFTFNNKIDFEIYTGKVQNTFNKFGFSKDKAYYTGSSITSRSSLGGGVFDTDWAINYSKKEFEELILEFEMRYKKASQSGVLAEGKVITEAYVKKKVKDMRGFYKKKGYLHKRYMVAIEDGNLITLESVLIRDFPDNIKTDITPVIDGVNVGYPRIKYNFN